MTYYFDRADLVFAGTAIASQVAEIRPLPHPDEIVAVTFDVDTPLKNADDARVRVLSSSQTTACGYVFQLHRRYQVFADRQADGSLTTSFCAGTSDLAADAAPLQPGRGLGGFLSTLAAAVLVLAVTIALFVHRTRSRRNLGPALAS